MTEYRTIQRNLFLQDRRAKLISRLKEVAIAAVAVLALGIVGEMDYQDAVAIDADSNPATLAYAAVHNK